jgi:hypothetical protein
MVPVVLPWAAWTLLCWVKCWLGFEESVGLAGDVADQAAFDLAVGPGLGAASGGVGAGGWVGAEPGQDHGVQGLVELAVPGAVAPNPDGLARGGGDGGGAAQHREGGIGAAAARMGPGAQHGGGHDRAHPARASRSGRQARTSTRMAWRWSAASAVSSRIRRAKLRKVAKVAAVVAVPTSQLAWTRNRAQAATSWRVERIRSRSPRTSGAAITSACSWRWASPAAWTAERRAANRTDKATRRRVDRSLGAGRAGRGPAPRGRP